MTSPAEMMTFSGNTTAGEEQATSRVSILNLSRLFGTTILFFYAWLIISASILFISGRGISVTNTLLAFGLTTVYFIRVSRKTFRSNWKLILTGFAIITLLSCLSYAISSRFFDLSWDGRDYNQKAIRALSSGWDPVYNEQQPTDIYYNTWLNHYPKGAWIASASLYQLTGNIEGAKVFNLLLIAAVFFMALAFCLHFPQLKTWQAVLISLMLAANPVSIYQSLSFYVDGQVASILTLLLLTFLLAFIQSDNISLISIFVTLLIGLNLKFTATAYVGLITIGLLAAGFYFVKRTLANIPNIQLVSANGLIGNSQTLSTKSRRFRWLLAVTIAGVFLGMLVAGINPYVTNLINYRNPFYPVWGDSVYNQEYIVGSQMPSNFEGKNRFQKLYLSIFSRSQNTYQKPTGPPKFPFSVTGSEIKAFLTTDIRIGGFGPLFGAALIFSAIALLLLFGKSRRLGWITLFLSGMLFASAAINPEVWWARYSPQLWLIPVILSIATLLVKQKRTQLASYLLMGTLLINLVLISGAYLVGNFRNTEQFDHVLTRLSNRQEKILVYYGPLDATATTLDSFHIQYQVVPVLEQLPCPKPLSPGAYYSFAEACPKSP